MSARSSFRDQTDVSSLAKVADGRDQVAGADGDFDGGELEVLGDVAELEALASAEALAGSTRSCPLWAGPQALSVRLTARHSPRVRRRVLEGALWERGGWRWRCAGRDNAALLVVRREEGRCWGSVPGLIYPMAPASSPATRVEDRN